MPANASADLSAQLRISPLKSQIFLFALSGISLAFLVASYFARGEPIAWAFFVGSLLTVGGGLWAWRTAQSDIDMEQSHPTVVETSTGTRVSTDTRLLRSKEGIAAITQVLDEVLHRRPLPEPSGLVDAEHAVIPNSQAAAIEMVGRVNRETQQITNSAVDQLGLAQDGLVGAQTPLEGAVGPAFTA